MARRKVSSKRIIPRLYKCDYCGLDIDLNGYDYVCDAAGKTLHDKCFEKRWKDADAKKNR